MSWDTIRFNATTDRLDRATNLPTFPALIMGWFRVQNDGNQVHCLMAYGSSTAPGNGSECQIFADMRGSTAGLLGYNSTGTTAGAAGTMAVGRWFHCAALIEDPDLAQDDMYVFLNGLLDITILGNADLVAPTSRLSIGNNRDSEFLDGNARNVMVFSGMDVATSLSFVKEQSKSDRPLRFGNLNAWYKLQNSQDVYDYSGNGNHLTAAGTLVTETAQWIGRKPRQLYPAWLRAAAAAPGGGDLLLRLMGEGLYTGSAA